MNNLFVKNIKKASSTLLIIDEISLNSGFTNDMFKETNLKETKTKVLTLGGEHSISYAPIKKYLQEFDEPYNLLQIFRLSIRINIHILHVIVKLHYIF